MTPDLPEWRTCITVATGHQPVDEGWTTILDEYFVNWVVIIVLVGLVLDTHDAGSVVLPFLAFVHCVAVGDHVVVVKLVGQVHIHLMPDLRYENHTVSSDTNIHDLTATLPLSQ